jgi:hypothetical protein
MATISVYQFFTVEIDARTVSAGSRTVAKEVAITDDEVYDQSFKIAPTTAVKIWDKTENEAMGNFDFLWLESDFDLLIQCTTDAGTSDDYDVKKLKGSGKAGEMGPAKVFGSDDTQLTDGTIDTFDGTADTIDEIWAYNESASDTARLRIVALT